MDKLDHLRKVIHDPGCPQNPEHDRGLLCDHLDCQEGGDGEIHGYCWHELVRFGDVTICKTDGSNCPCDCGAEEEESGDERDSGTENVSGQNSTPA